MTQTKYVNSIVREEQHSTQRQIVPTVRNAIQNFDRIQYAPVVQRVEQHLNQTQVVPST